MGRATEPFVHVLLFQCRQCSCPTSLAITSGAQNLEDFDRRSYSVKCNTCGWTGELIGTEAKRHWVDAWEPDAETGSHTA